MKTIARRLRVWLTCRRSRAVPLPAVGRLLFVSAAVLALELTAVASAWAVQTHGGAEGLAAHQIGHALFSFGLVYLGFRLHSMRMQGEGWPEFKMFLLLLVCWNVVTFLGHWMDEFIPASKFVMANGSTHAFVAENFLDVVFYLTRLDHLLLVPSFAFLVLALKKWRTVP